MDRLDIDKKRAIELGARYVNNFWKSLPEEEVELTILSGGYSSRLYLVEDISTSTENPIKKFLIRLYGGKLIPENDPVKPAGGEIKETLVFYAMDLNKLGPKLYGSFDGGRVEQFLPSHMLREEDYKQRPETLLELARKLARFHSLDLPISQERYDVLNVCEYYHRNRDFEKFRKLAKHLGVDDLSNFEEFDIKSEADWSRSLEDAVNGRIVTISGDVNKNNVLVRDEPDTFGERVMMIDYELCARDYRGRDIGQVFLMKIFEMKDGYFYICCDYPDEAWRRTFVEEYLKETRSLNYFEWDEKLDSVDHLLMEAEFFMFHSVQLFLGFFTNVKDDSPLFNMPVDQAKSMVSVFMQMIDVYRNRKANFVEKYGKQLDSKN
ncbi:Choline/ethanolamine kinase [Pseudolycoriella hygida]|uniref:Choline/ethanolamine kinase n=1 Tax=Pseudolycoriella hygida TaxID=35572 RepID=A0A9Q0N863_9DIPT|nr:Choline/ethanolamine kinase [Pseudolycoriella hygida]